MSDRKLIEALYIINKLAKSENKFHREQKGDFYKQKTYAVKKAFIKGILSIEGVHDRNLTLYTPTDRNLSEFSFHQIEEDPQIKEAYGSPKEDYNGSDEDIDWDRCKCFSKGMEKEAIDYVKDYVNGFSFVKCEDNLKKYTKNKLLEQLDENNIRRLGKELKFEEFNDNYNKLLLNAFSKIADDPTVLDCLRVFTHHIRKKKVDINNIADIKNFTARVLDISFCYDDNDNFIFKT